MVGGLGRDGVLRCVLVFRSNLGFKGMDRY